MTLDEYQNAARETALWHEREFKIPPLVYCSLKLAGEAGEVAEKVGKAYRDRGGDVVHDELIKEIGDCLWYLAMLADLIDCPLSEVARANVEKLSGRKERGVLGGSGDNR